MDLKHVGVKRAAFDAGRLLSVDVEFDIEPAAIGRAAPDAAP